MDRYQFQWMPKAIFTSAFDYEELFGGKIACLVDDPNVLKKTASSQVVSEWGDIKPLKDHSLIHLIGLGASERTGQNRNGDGFKRALLQREHDTFRTKGALYRDHNSKVPWEQRDGDVVKTAYNDDMDRVELLVAARHDKCADWLSDIEKGKRVDFSMGFDCKYDVCTICGNKAKTRKDYCDCVKRGAKAPFGMGRVLDDGRKCGVDNPEGHFNDISKVGTGADMIAQHLRKVAHLNDGEALGGAELMERLGMDFAAKAEQSVKMATAHKLSRMEKQVPVTSFRPSKSTERISQKVASKLRAAEPPVMFAQLAKVGAMLNCREFFKLTLGSKFAEHEPLVDAAEGQLSTLFTDICASPERLDAVCNSRLYDCGKTAHLSGPILTPLESALICEEFSLHPEIAEQRSVKIALYGDRVEYTPVNQKLREPVEFLLNEYAAYKLAALEGTQWSLNDALILSAVMAR